MPSKKTTSTKKKSTGKAKATKVAKPTAPVKARSSKPTWKEMISEAIMNLKDRTGSSRQAIKKYILANYDHVTEEKAATPLKNALSAGVEAGLFHQNKQSFRIATNRRKFVKEQMMATPGKRKKSGPKRVNRPIKKTMIELLDNESDKSLSFKLLLKRVMKKLEITAPATCKAVITRGTTDGVFSRSGSGEDEEDVITLVKEAVEEVKTSKKKKAAVVVVVEEEEEEEEAAEVDDEATESEKEEEEEVESD